MVSSQDVTPLLTAANPTIGLNVDPGAYCPWTALLNNGKSLELFSDRYS